MSIDGTTRLIGIIGNPIAQVKAPAALNPMLAARGLNTVLVPFHVAPADSRRLRRGRARRGIDALVVTVPHKVAVLRHVDRIRHPGVQRVGAANLVRREPDGAFAAEITDGLGFLGAARAAGFEPTRAAPRSSWGAAAPGPRSPAR